MKSFLKILSILFLFYSCADNTSKKLEVAVVKEKSKTEIKKNPKQKQISYTGKSKSIHVLVALCDNENQGIVPVPKNLGNGQNPKSNLYWGAAYDIKTYFKRSKEWKLLNTRKVNDTILERLVFKHKTQDFYLVADAYDGKHIKTTTIDFLKSISGIVKDTIIVNSKVIGIHGNSELISYIGHDGLMDFDMERAYINTDNKQRDAIILACYSKDYFSDFLRDANANPLVWSTGLMAPEAYTLHDAMTGYVKNKSNEEIRIRAAKAYSNYQKCSLRAAKKLLVSN